MMRALYKNQMIYPDIQEVSTVPTPDIIVEDEKNDLYIAEASHGQYFGRIDSFRSPNNTAYRIRTTGKTNNTNMGVSVTSGVSTSSASGTISSGSSQNNGDIGSSAFYFAWPEGESEKRIKPESKDAWYKMVEENLGHPPNNHVEEGASSVVFVWGVLRHAGLINNFKIGRMLPRCILFLCNFASLKLKNHLQSFPYGSKQFFPGLLRYQHNVPGQRDMRLP